MVRIPASLNFFQAFFSHVHSCVFNCDDPLYLYFFIPQFKYIKFIYSSLVFHCCIFTGEQHTSSHPYPTNQVCRSFLLRPFSSLVVIPFKNRKVVLMNYNREIMCESLVSSLDSRVACVEVVSVPC